MCDNWEVEYSKKFSCENVILNSGNGEYTVNGSLPGAGNNTILFWAPNPPTYCQGFSGSGLPYPNADIAYENSTNRGAVKSQNDNFTFKIKYPNSYYAGLGTVLVEPVCHVKICGNSNDTGIHTIKLGNGIPFRLLTYQAYGKDATRDSPMFYTGRDTLPIRGQEQILRDSAYPETNVVPDNFWGLRPPDQ